MSEKQKIDLRTVFNGQHWVFLCFTPERAQQLAVMLTEQIVASGRGMEIGHAYFPAGVLWNGRECNMRTVSKAQLKREDLAKGLRKHFGYENPEGDSDVFTLGVSPEEDEALGRVGLFGRMS